MKVFWDTNLFIYLWENSANTEKVLQLAGKYSANDDQLCTSTLSLGEILVKPFSDGKLDQVENYLRKFQEIEIVPFGAREAIAFAQLRGQFPSLKPPDVIQLSCALESGAEQFITNDNRLNRLNLEGMAVFSLEGISKKGSNAKC